MKEKFTKGEWSIKPLEDDKEYIRIRGTVLGGKFKIANVIDLKNHHDNESLWCKRDREESMANANLIAQAPAMYEMLKQISEFKKMVDDGVNVHGGMSGMMGSIDMIDELLTKARGES